MNKAEDLLEIVKMSNLLQARKETLSDREWRSPNKVNENI